MLTDADALVAGQELSTAKRIKIVARLSSSGSATPQAGDWEAVSDSFILDNEECSSQLNNKSAEKIVGYGFTVLITKFVNDRFSVFCHDDNV